MKKTKIAVLSGAALFVGLVLVGCSMGDDGGEAHRLRHIDIVGASVLTIGPRSMSASGRSGVAVHNEAAPVLL